MTVPGGGIPQGDGNTWMPDVWGYLMVKYRIGIMLDVGCGYGYALEWFSRCGMCNCVGIDGDKDAIDRNVARAGMPTPVTVVHHDFKNGPYVHGIPFDMTMSIEFLEHVDERFLPNIAPCFQAARYALVTHGEPHQSGTHHVNCRPSSYWINVFGQWGFDYDAAETDVLRSTDRCRAPWGRRTLMWFVRR